MAMRNQSWSHSFLVKVHVIIQHEHNCLKALKKCMRYK
ncbi:hypothetical protein UUU_21210 [Klebsiella pneumoniae subsp. pneumoniae DSM 30104 = JCM 1662 = NBRC 14940]|nr:hypothetical protein UUU_21210 [Klebsiella pneumoniae subsp. pneumoniae DSM 30104 = JCM 1662 = NBRC 14940]